jgi:hypothetical protein
MIYALRVAPTNLHFPDNSNVVIVRKLEVEATFAKCNCTFMRLNVSQSMSLVRVSN